MVGRDKPSRRCGAHSSSGALPPSPMRLRLLLLLVTLYAAVGSSSSVAVSSSGFSPSDGSSSVDSGAVSDEPPHCAQFLDHCEFNASTSSCTFHDSVTFRCGAQHAVNGSALPLPAVMDCRWELTGDFILAENVSVSLHGDDCALRLSIGKMLVLAPQAQLRAASLSVDASFVRLEHDASFVARLAGGGAFRGRNALFPGDTTRGSSHGGSGGRRLHLNETTATPQQTFGAFFDVRPPGAMATLAASAWDLEKRWALALDDPENLDHALLLLGGGSTNGSSTTGGGGRIRVVASRDLVLMPGASILANGEDATVGTSGAAGGSVFLSAKALSLAQDCVVQARGGHATCAPRVGGVFDCFPGGGGGRVHIAYVSSQLDNDAVDVSGGCLLAADDDQRERLTKLVHTVEQRALAGGGGTYLRVFRASKSGSSILSSPSPTADKIDLYIDEASGSEAALILTNRRATVSITSDTQDATNNEDEPPLVGVGAVTPVVVDASHRRLNMLSIVDGAVVATRGMVLPAGDLEIRNGSFLLDASVCDRMPTSADDSTSVNDESANTVTVDAHGVTISDHARVLLPAQSLTVLAHTLAMDATVELRFSQRVTLASAKNLHVDATIRSFATSDTDDQALALVGGADVTIGGDSITAGTLFLHADGSLVVTTQQLDASRAASIDARFQPCDPKRAKKSDRSAAALGVAAAFLDFARRSNFTMLLQASQSIAIGIPPPKPALFTTTTTAAATSSASSPDPPLPVGITASAILVCAENEIEIGDAAVVASSGRGEQANQGPGSGACVGSAGGGGGYGGRGADSTAVNQLGDFATGGLAYGTRSGIGMLGSGGGCVDGGAGGGVVMLGARGVVLNGQVYCNGDGAVNSGGGGSGGFLGLTIADYLRGHGRISAVGGGAQCLKLADPAVAALQQPQQPGEDINATLPFASRLRLEAQIAEDTSVEQQTTTTTATTETTTTITKVCGGGGGGGRLQLHGCEKNDIDKCTSGFDGNYTVAGGSTSQYHSAAAPATVAPAATDGGGDLTAAPALEPAPVDVDVDLDVPAAASGSFVGFPCLPGSGGLFCRVCLPGTFKAESNSEECLVCSNAPSNAHYEGVGAVSPACDWACDPGYSGESCVSPIEQLLDACGGILGFGLVLLSIVLFLILLGYACRTRKEPSYARAVGRHGRGDHDGAGGSGVTGSKSERQHLLSSAIASTQRSRFAFLLRWLYWPRVGYPKLVERDLHEHMARIYLTGMNDRDAPLKLRLTVPAPLKSVLYDDEFRQLAERINAALAWPTGVFASWGEVVYRLVVVLCFPAASAVLAYRRHLRLNALKRIVGRYNHACMKGPRARGLLNALKLGYSGDYSLVYLELLYKESSQSACVPTTAIGKPALPIVLLFAGRGTYESPFFLDPSDLLVRSIPQCSELTAFIDEPWIEFVAELNELLRVVSNKDFAMVETLLPVAQFLEAKMAATTIGGGGGGAAGGGGGGGIGINGGAAAAAVGNKLGGLRIYLGRFYVGDEIDSGEEFKLGILVTTDASESAATAAMHPHESTMLPSGGTPNGPSSGGNGRYGYGGPGSYGATGARNLDTLDGYGRALPTEDALLAYDPVSGGWSYAPMGANAGRGGAGLLRRGSSSGLNNVNANANASGPPSHKSTVSSIREEALRIRSNTSGSVDNLFLVGAGHRLSDFDSPELHPRRGFNGNHRELRRRRRRQTFYEGWLGPVDGSLPVPGVLISADELEDRLTDQTKEQRLESFLRRHLLPTNVPQSKWLWASWMVHGALLTLLMVDLAITFAMVVNLQCVTNGEVDTECSATILLPVLMLPPLTLFLAPIMGIVSLAIASTSFSRRYSIWNTMSMGNVLVAILVCVTQSSRLVAPWFTAPVPLLPVIALAVKAGEAYAVERYIAYQETNRRRRGWRGLMKRRFSDASIPVESPYASPVSSDSTPSYMTTNITTFR